MVQSSCYHQLVLLERIWVRVIEVVIQPVYEDVGGFFREIVSRFPLAHSCVGHCFNCILISDLGDTAYLGDPSYRGKVSYLAPIS